MPKIKITILIVDDLRRVRQGLKLYLELIEDFKIVGEAMNGVEAIRLANELKPDIVLMDLNMPMMNGFEVTSYLKQNHFTGGVIILTIHDEIKNMEYAKKVGADKFLVKGISMTELNHSIREVWNVSKTNKIGVNK